MTKTASFTLKLSYASIRELSATRIVMRTYNAVGNGKSRPVVCPATVICAKRAYHTRGANGLISGYSLPPLEHVRAGQWSVSTSS